MEQYPQLYNIVSRRYSYRDYSNEPVAKDIIVAILDVARLAPSACNKQPWRFLVIDPSMPELRTALQESYPRDWFKAAPVYIVACGLHDEAWHRPADGKDSTDTDVSIAVEHICLAAATLGLGTCWIGNFDVNKVTAALEIPQEVEPVAIISLGYPATPAIPEKKRKELDETAKWGKY